MSTRGPLHSVGRIEVEQEAEMIPGDWAELAARELLALLSAHG